jgi:hypothetical protein
MKEIEPTHRMKDRRREWDSNFTKKEKPINRIAVDFDNTICNTHFNEQTGVYELGSVYEPVAQVMTDQFWKGKEVVIYTARPKKEWHLIKNYLNENGIPYNRIKKKLLAEVYIDDRNLRPDEAFIWNRNERKTK